MLKRLFIFRYLLSKSKGSLVRIMAILSVGGIGIGVTAMIVILSVMEGFDGNIKERLLGVEPHLVIGYAQPELKDQIQELVGANAEVLPFAHQDVLIWTVDGLHSGAEAQGVDRARLKSLGRQLSQRVEVIEDGGEIHTQERLVSNLDFDLGRREVALGRDLAGSLGIFEGDEITIIAPESLLLPSGELPIFEKAKVKALLKTNVEDIDRRGLFYDRSNGLPKLKGAASLSHGYEVRFKNPDDAFGVTAQLQEAGLSDVRTWKDLNSALFYSLDMEKTLMGLFLGITILVSSFSIISILILLVSEKKKDVGLLKAIGASKVRVQELFISVGLTLGLSGIVGGVILGLGICFILDTFTIFELPDIYYDTTLPVEVEYWVVGGIIFFGVVLSYFGALIPSWKISRLDPIKALKGTSDSD